MSARSPRGSISGASNLADDFRESLQDLTQNNRLEISNLTLIAKESTEYAQGISKVLEEHIKTTAPNRKLPALYVLDSIVKNVGTPYTVYLGRGLYSTFMEAYTQMDSNTRRSMEAMLKTWKEPVPGSMDPRPVFPPETVKPIENALIKAKTAALQNQRHVQPQPGYRHTPTPPQYGHPYAQAPAQQPYPQYPGQQPQHLQPPFQPQNYQRLTPVQLSGNDAESIKTEVSALISRMQVQFAASPHDEHLRTKLQALLQLQAILKAQNLGHAELQQIKTQISQLSAVSTPILTHRPTPPPAVSTPQWQPPVPAPQPYAQGQPFAPYGQPASQSQPPPSILAPGALNGLQALPANGQKPSTPQIRNAAPALQNASHAQLNSVAAAPALNSADLLAALTKNKLLPNLPASNPLQSAPSPASAVPLPPTSTAALLQSLQGLLPPISQSGIPAMPPTNKPKISMTASSLKGFRPDLIKALYDAQPNQCTTCGRRFLSTPSGRAKKDRHLDWHFRTNQRMADPNTSGQHRNWFVDEIEWIRLSEFDPSTTTAEESAAAAAGATGGAAGGRGKKAAKDSFVRAPPGMTRNTCSICYEEMRSEYSEELQDWVFGNAVKFGKPARIVHGTCAEEIRKSAPQPAASRSAAAAGVGSGGGSLAAALSAAAMGGRSRSATPDSALGKRKAEAVLAGLGSRVKTE